MDFDDDIVPLTRKMDDLLLRMQSELLPLIASLDEDVLVTNYTVDEQARISLAMAFALVLLTYSHDRAQHVVGKAGVDARVQLKMERISGYVKKLREITLLESKHPEEEKEKTIKTVAGAETSTNVKKARKRQREETHDSEAVESSDVNAADDPYGDAILFNGIERGAGNTAALVQNLLKHVNESSNS